jgi:hypothetical protein
MLLSHKAGEHVLLSHRIHCCCFAGHVLDIGMCEACWRRREGASATPPTTPSASTHDWQKAVGIESDGPGMIEKGKIKGYTARGSLSPATTTICPFFFNPFLL